MHTIRWFHSVLGMLLILIISVPVFAHKPISIGGVFPSFDQALQMTDIDVSQVVYSPLNEAYPHLWLVFQAEAGTRLDVSLGVPVLDRLVGYRPQLAVLGPGLPPLELGFEMPPDVGGLVFESASIDQPRFFHEPFTGTDSWILLEEAVTLPETGTYYVVAWPSGEQVDKLWVAIGVREQFGPRDFATFPAIIREARAFHEVGDRPYWLQTVGRLALFGLFAGILVWLLTRN
jgi:hypothetical protein